MLHPMTQTAAATDTRPKTAVLQQRGGIGDFIWQIPYFRAAAAQSRDGKVSIITRSTTRAKDLVGHESWVEEIIHYDFSRRSFDKEPHPHAGLRGMWRMAREMRRRRFDRILIFTDRPARALLAWIARIPRRAGYGFRLSQRLFLNEAPYIKRHDKPTFEAYWEATDFAIARHLVTAPIVPKVTVQPAIKEQMRARLAGLPAPWCALVIGSTTEDKQWGAKNFSELAAALLAQGKSVLILGGERESALAREILQLLPAEAISRTRDLTSLPLPETAAALSLSQMCIGNDTGVTHLAAACDCPAWMLIGSKNRFDHDPQMLRMITATGIKNLPPSEVLARIAVARAASP